MAELVQRYLDQILAEHADDTGGALADYIPELTRVDPDGFGLSLSLADGYVYESRDTALEFTIQSVSKPFTYALALDRLGFDAVDAKIGVEPSGEAFNEISVDETTKAPKNPMINAGAIATVSLVPGTSADERFDQIRDFYSACAGRELTVDDDIYPSEKATGSRNRAIAYMLQSFGVLDGDPDEILDVYFRQCSIKVTTTDLAQMAATLARGGIDPVWGRRVAAAAVVQRTLSVMVTCGMYDAAGTGSAPSACRRRAASAAESRPCCPLSSESGSTHRCWTTRATACGGEGVPRSVGRPRTALPFGHPRSPLDDPGRVRRRCRCPDLRTAR